MEKFNLEIPLRKERLDEQMQEIHQRVESIRSQMKTKVNLVLKNEAAIDEKIDGKVFVENVGTIIDVNKGNFDYHYNKEGIKMRDFAHLNNQNGIRSQLFYFISSLLPEKSRVLNIGAGGDQEMVKGIQMAGHEIINTDFSQETVDILKQRTGAPGFACDLKNLDLVMPENGVDVVMGNSVLGYMDPQKIKMVAEKLFKVMKKGGVFTFDLAPHPNYLRILNPKEERTVVNSMEMDPAELLDNMRKFGPIKGAQITRMESGLKAHSMKCALMQIWQNLFEQMGCKTRLSMTPTAIGMLGVLRVSKTDDSILNSIQDEFVYENADQMWLADADKIKSPFICIDSHFGPQIAEALNIPYSPKRLFERVTFEIDEIDSKEKSEVMEKYCPSNLLGKIEPYLNGERIIKEPKTINQEILREQTMNKQLLAALLHSPTYKPPLSDAQRKIKQRQEKNKSKKRRK